MDHQDRNISTEYQKFSFLHIEIGLHFYISVKTGPFESEEE